MGYKYPCSTQQQSNHKMKTFEVICNLQSETYGTDWWGRDTIIPLLQKWHLFWFSFIVMRYIMKSLKIPKG